MIVAAFSVKPYDQQFLEAAAKAAGAPVEWRWFSEPLRAETARLAEGATAVCCFVNDTLDAACIETLATIGVKLICCGVPALIRSICRRPRPTASR